MENYIDSGISVCIATYNGSMYIKEQILSILVQLSEQDEIIVSDDHSMDNTVSIIEQLNDPRIKIVYNNLKSSPINNFENALKYVSNEIILLSDQDDIWYPDKVNQVKKGLCKYDLIISNAQLISKEGNIIKDIFFKTSPPLDIFSNILKNNFFGATMGFKKCVLEKSLPFPKYIPMHDQWIGMIAAYYFSVGYIDKPLIKYRRHDSNASFCGEKSQNSLYKKIIFRLNILFSLLKKIVFTK